ncbi:MAG: cupredoxin domain-containing protein [Gammaproteobacteria bacterium]|nr:cupredoxin domain-containing protein [Gammaproteobacteria bacterium]MBU1655894.1 cupredoxin domain-containing protein [Gammaproteobacteria bacterium]MBU1961009.1 cupredoxin domain-containing protein [Gammaproteobacteria bacterium]
MNGRQWLVIVGLIWSLALPALGAETHEVVIQKFRFEPQEVHIKAGDSLRWVNREKRQHHSVLFESQDWPESDYLFPEDSYEKSFPAPGVYPYRCGPHPEMTGTVHVE